MNTPESPNRVVKISVSVIAAVLALPLLYFGYRLISYKQINGKVLIVQKDADVKKLALIQIGAVEAEDVVRWKTAVNERLRVAVEKIHLYQKEAATEEAEIVDFGGKRVANALDCINRTEEAIEAARKIWLVERNSSQLRSKISDLLTRGNIPRNQELLELTKNNNWQDVYHLLSEASLPDAKHIHELAASDFKSTLDTHQKDYRKKLISMREALDFLIPPSTVKALPKDVKIRAHDVTDESGSFSLQVAPGDYYIFAEGDRMVFTTTEHYFWAHPITVPSQESEKCLMGNLNLDGESTHRDDLWRELRRTIAEQKCNIQP